MQKRFWEHHGLDRDKLSMPQTEQRGTWHAPTEIPRPIGPVYTSLIATARRKLPRITARRPEVEFVSALIVDAPGNQRSSSCIIPKSPWPSSASGFSRDSSQAR